MDTCPPVFAVKVTEYCFGLKRALTVTSAAFLDISTVLLRSVKLRSEPFVSSQRSNSYPSRGVAVIDTWVE